MRGDNNIFEIGDMAILYDVTISVEGSNNKVIIGDKFYLSGCSFLLKMMGMILFSEALPYISKHRDFCN